MIAGATHALGAPPDWNPEMGTCDALPVRLVVDPDLGSEWWSTWAPSPDELVKLLNGGAVRLKIVGGIHPPCGIEVVDADPTPPPADAREAVYDHCRRLGLSIATASAAARFALAMVDKLGAAEAKYDWQDAWRGDGAELIRAELVRHIAKGDPVDVANFCLFLWALGERTVAP
jgi:hypothetical protein